MRHARIGGIALIVFALAGVAWFALELSPPRLGFADTDDPAVSLDFLRAHGIVYAYAGLALFSMAAALLVASSVVADQLDSIHRTLVARIVAGVGLTAAIFFFGHGVLRSSWMPLLYIEGLDPAWGQAAYLAMQTAGVHGFAQGGIVAFSAWAILVSLVGVQSGTVPRWVAVLGILPAFRLVTSLLGPLGVLDGIDDALWIASMAAIVGSMLWPLALGVWLLLQVGPPSSSAIERRASMV